MPEDKNLAQRWEEFRPSKGLWLWSCVGSVALALILGFTVGGWVTGGTANRMAEDAADTARAKLVASACVEKFVASPAFAMNLAKLKETDSWQRDDYIADGGWVTLAGMEEPMDSAADLCVNDLANMKAPTEASPASEPIGNDKT